MSEKDNNYKHYVWGTVIQTIAIFALIAFLATKCNAQESHEHKPNGNQVAAGNNWEYASRTKIAGWIVLGSGAVVTGILGSVNDTKNTAAPWIAGGITVAATAGLNIHSLKWEISSASFLQHSFLPSTYYEQIADSLGDDPPVRYRLRDYVDGKKIHIPIRQRGPHLKNYTGGKRLQWRVDRLKAKRERQKARYDKRKSE